VIGRDTPTSPGFGGVKYKPTPIPQSWPQALESHDSDARTHRNLRVWNLVDGPSTGPTNISWQDHGPVATETDSGPRKSTDGSFISLQQSTYQPQI